MFYFRHSDKIVLSLFPLTATLLICWWQVRLSSIMIPRDLIQSVGWSRLSFSLRRKSESVCFFHDLKRTASVLITLRKFLFALSQLFTEVDYLEWFGVCSHPVYSFLDAERDISEINKQRVLVWNKLAHGMLTARQI